MMKRRGATLVELIIVIIISAVFLAAVFMGINIVIRSLEYAKKIVYKMYHQNQIEISLEILNAEIQNAGSMVSVVRNLDDFKTKTVGGTLSRGVLAENENEFFVQYGITNTFTLKDTESGTYVKIIKNAPLPPTISYNSESFWYVLTTEGFKESTATTLKLSEASLTHLESYYYNVADDCDTFVFFVYVPELSKKVLKVNSKPYLGEQIAQSIFSYSETEKTLVLKKYLPFVGETIETVLLDDLESFEVLFGVSESSSEITYKTIQNMEADGYLWDVLKTLKILFQTRLPKSDELITTEKIFWLPEGDS
jgi:type II secretory pathway pseudopilin PulG